MVSEATLHNFHIFQHNTLTAIDQCLCKISKIPYSIILLLFFVANDSIFFIILLNFLWALTCDGSRPGDMPSIYYLQLQLHGCSETLVTSVDMQKNTLTIIHIF